MWYVQFERELALLKEVQIEFPEIFLSHLFLEMIATPLEDIPIIRVQPRGKPFIRKNLQEVIVQMYGADSSVRDRDVSDVKASISSAKRCPKHKGRAAAAHHAEDSEPEGAEALCTAEGWQDWRSYRDFLAWQQQDEDDDDAYYYDDEEAHAAEAQAPEVPGEFGVAFDKAEEAYVSFVEAKPNMKELAQIRGFYPVVAIRPNNVTYVVNMEGFRKPAVPSPSARYRQAAAKGNGKRPKGAGKGKRGKGPRKGPPAAPQSTASGSTQQHGPRFKRMRDGKSEDGNLVEEVSEEEVWMMHEESSVEHSDEETEFHTYENSSNLGPDDVPPPARRTVTRTGRRNCIGLHTTSACPWIHAEPRIQKWIGSDSNGRLIAV